MARLQQTQRKRVGSAPRLPDDVVAAIAAEVKTYQWLELCLTGIFVGYPLSIKAFRVYNLRTKVVMESINVSFDDKKITGLKDFVDHDQLRFENEDSYSDTENPDSLSPDTANSDGLNSDVIETVVTTSDSSSSDKPSSDSTENLNTEESNSESIVSGGASENENEDSMDHGGASSSRENLPSARKWTKSHTPDLII
ncbi:hypothetical protein AgCh_020065 [Apium graveolens]